MKPVPDYSASFKNPDLLKMVARDAFQAGGGEDWNSGIHVFTQWINDDAKLFRAMSEPLLTLAIKDIMFKFGQSSRAQTFRDKTVMGAQNLRKGKVIIGERRFMEIGLNWGGRHFALKNATKELLLNIAARDTSTGKTTIQRATFYAAIADNLPVGKKTVGQVLTEKRLEELWLKIAG